MMKVIYQGQAVGLVENQDQTLIYLLEQQGYELSPLSGVKTVEVTL